MRSEWIRSYQHLWKTGPKQKNTSAFGCLRLLCLLCSPLGDLQVSGTLSSKFLSEGANFAKFECCLVTSRVHTGLYICFGDALSPQGYFKDFSWACVPSQLNSQMRSAQDFMRNDWLWVVPCHLSGYVKVLTAFSPLRFFKVLAWVTVTES